MRIPATTAPHVGKPAFSVSLLGKKTPIKSKDFRSLLTPPASSARSERPVGVDGGESKKRIAPCPTDPAPTEGLARQSKRGSEVDPDSLDRSGQSYDPLALLVNVVAPREPVRSAEAPSPSPLWVSETIRRIAWGGDRQRGTAHVELGAGPYAGSTLQVHAEGGSLRLEVTAPTGVDAGALVEHIGARFAERGLRIESVRVR